MSARKSERLLNLLILLLVQQRFIAKDRIREILYPGHTDEAFDRKFDRDKEELRSIGVPIEVGTVDPYFEDEVGYRIRPDRFALPQIQLEADEAAVVGLATKVWEHARLAEATSGAVTKLRAAGIDVDPGALELAETRLWADEPAFDPFLTATWERRAVRFDYRRAGSAETAPRHVQPWGLVRFSGRWYAVGFDLDRGAERVFRLSRVTGEVRPTGRPGAFTPPEGIDLRGIVADFEPATVRAEATVLIRPGAAAGLRRRGEHLGRVTGPDGEQWDRVRLPESGEATADELLSFGADVFVEAPAQLRAEIITRLSRALGAAG